MMKQTNPLECNDISLNADATPYANNVCVDNEYKKIEEDLGIDLVTLLKALKYFWKLDNNKKPICIHYPFLRKNENCKEYELVFNQQAFGDTGIRDAHIFYDSVWLKDCGKTWALEKKELL